jgi:hypothetical protein
VHARSATADGSRARAEGARVAASASEPRLVSVQLPLRAIHTRLCTCDVGALRCGELDTMATVMYSSSSPSRTDGTSLWRHTYRGQTSQVDVT